MIRDDIDDPIAIYEDSNHILHFIPCDESQKKMDHTLAKECFCQPYLQEILNDGKPEKVWVHNKILH